MPYIVAKKQKQPTNENVEVIVPDEEKTTETPKTNAKKETKNSKVEEKNSLLRLGLFVSGPVYQPGHRTYSFLRVYNMSNSEIKLQKDFKIAQIFFEELTGVPEETYDKKSNASFNNENKYVRYGKYEKQYNELKK